MLCQQNFNSFLPTNLIFGFNSIKNDLVDKIKEFDKSKVFIATDQGLVEAGIIHEIDSLLKEQGIETVVFSEVEPNPHADTVMRGLKVYNEEACDILLAVGGGSAIDFAKAVGVVVANPGHILDYRRGQKTIMHQPPILFAVPTTVGTGSEVTSVSVITDREASRKYVIASPKIAPEIAIVDPSLTLTLPRQIVSTTAMDALVHAIETYVSLKANPLTDGLSMQAIKILHEYLPATYANPNNIEARSQVHLASAIAGIAFGLGALGMVHSCSHPMSAVHNVPHGLANAIILPAVVEHNLIANIKKYAEIARVFNPKLHFETDRVATGALPKLIQQFNQQLDIPVDFSHLGIEFTEEMIERLSNDAMDDVGTIHFNPRKAIKEDVIKIYEKVLPLNKKRP